MTRPKTAIAFAVVVALCLAQVTWWIVFQFRESARFQEAAEAVAAGDQDAAARALGVGADGRLDNRFHRRRVMFAAEGAFLGVCALLGVGFFYMMMLRERRVHRERERFLTGATHEFKTPLATLQLGLQSLLDGRLADEARVEYMHAMLEEVARLERGINNLLAAARLRDTARTDAVEIGDLIADAREVAEEFAPRFRAAGIEFETRFEGALPIARERAGLRLVLHNLLDNALRYAGAGRSVAIEARRDGSHAELVVRDDGPGIAAEDLPRVFDAFYRGNHTEHVGGSGLGLHLARTFVERHGGSISADAVTPHGTRFVVRLPLHEGRS